MKPAALAFTAIALAGCAVRATDAPAITAEYPVPYDALGECVYANSWAGPGTRYEPLPTMKEIRISEHMGFDTGRIMTFRPSTSGGTTVELRAAVNAAGQFEQFRPAIDACVAQLAQ